MICIWSGNLTSTWCVLCLQQIIKNMTGWATRILKPELSSCISRVISESPSVFVYPLDHLGKVKKEWHEERITKQSDLQKGNKKQRPLFGYPPAERSFDIFMSTIKPAANTASELSKEDGKPRPLFDDSLTQKDSDPLNNTVKSTLNAASDLPKKAGELNPLFGYPPTERQSDTLTSTIKPTVNAASGLPEETGNPHSLFSYPPTEIRSDRSMTTADTTTPLASRNVEPATRGKKRIMHNGRYITINLPSVDNRKCHLGKLNNLDADALGSDNSVHLPREPETAPAARVEIQGESASDNTVTQGGVGSSGSSQGASFYTAREISSPVEDLSQMYCTYETTKSSSRRAHNTWWESYYFGLDENLDKGEDNDEDNGEDNGEDNDEDNDEYNDEDNDEDSDDDDDDDESYVPSTNSDMDMSESEASSESSSTDEEATTSITNTDGERNPSEINNEENANKSTDLASQGVSSSGRIRLLSEIEIKKTLLKAVFALDKSEFASLKTVPEILQGLSRAELYSALWRYSEAEYTEDTPKEIDQTMSKDEIDQTKAQLQDMSKTSLGENLLIFLCSPDLFFDICSDFLNLDHVLRIGAEALDIIHSKSPLPID
ncbi:hypothetical protein BGW36DRAFT_128404 [Talaromyces proteolyticus]|uniref:Uncharacterized protein n=1 Tax=Talaromyces proteolyticus TaxID=1131652 RepID=A0AAD4Q022_9EURO|nr:uncharacterized protein BGW36DRAFT_128404 [Talaromyces proteolyticus]KAH8700384.1 hypothetical protein BGW36DRAFT_128404 [Talaromyces proteolyticus]